MVFSSDRRSLKLWKTKQNHCSYDSFSCLSNINFSVHLTFWLPLSYCAGRNTELLSGRSISKTVREKVAFTTNFLKEYSISFLMISSLIDFAFVVLQLLMFEFCGIIRISKIVFFLIFPVLERLIFFCLANIFCSFNILQFFLLFNFFFLSRDRHEEIKLQLIQLY